MCLPSASGPFVVYSVNGVSQYVCMVKDTRAAITLLTVFKKLRHIFQRCTTHLQVLIYLKCHKLRHIFSALHNAPTSIDILKVP